MTFVSESQMGHNQICVTCRIEKRMPLGASSFTFVPVRQMLSDEMILDFYIAKCYSTTTADTYPPQKNKNRRQYIRKLSEVLAGNVTIVQNN